MLSRYTIKVKDRVGLGIITLLVASVLISSSHHVLTALAWICLDVGLALCIWGAISHATNKGYAPPNWLRSTLVGVVAVGVYAAVVTFVTSGTWLVFDLAAICFAPRLHSVADFYPGIVVGVVITSIVAPYYSLLAAAATAPDRRFFTVKVLGICYLCVSAYVLFIMWFAFNFGMWGGIWTSALVWIFVPWTGGCVAVVRACARVRLHESRLRRTQQGMSDNSLERTPEHDDCGV
jgi:hypothetical protein